MEEGVEQNEQNRKKIIFIIIFFLILVIGGVIFVYKSCEPRVKEEENQIENFDEYSAFINANTKFTCEIIKNQELANDTAKMEGRLKEIYAEYNFPVENDAAMFEILNKYENDLEVTAIIKSNSDPCYEGGNPIFSQSSPQQ